MRFLFILLALFIGFISQPVNAVEVQEVTGKKGVTAWLAEDNTLPMVVIKMAFKKAGSAYDPEGKEGLAFMVASLLSEGAGDLDGLEFKKQLEQYAIHLEFDVDEDVFYISIKTLTEHLDRTLSLLKSVLLSPRFDVEAVERKRQNILLLQLKQSEEPSRLATKTFQKKAFPNHPYGNPVYGSEEGVNAITREDLVDYIKQRFTRAQFFVAVSGDINKETLAPLLDQYFGELRHSSSSSETVEEIKVSLGVAPSQVAIESDQSVAVFGQRGVKRLDPEFYPSFIMNQILGGGGFESRLMQEVREERGLAYSVYTMLETYPHTGILIGKVSTDAARINESLNTIFAEFKRLQTEGVTAEELQQTKDYLIGSFPLRLGSNSTLASYLLGMQLKDLGKDFLDKRNDYVRAVTHKEVNEAARTLLDPDNMILVVVGPNEQVSKNE